tara:strand:- start:3508 stop:4605 length:1098 start_codon:yes stop_codon:yes gene_type:complete
MERNGNYVPPDAGKKLTGEKKSGALGLLCGPPPLPATVVCQQLGLNKGTLSKWIRRWREEGRIVEINDTLTISSWITGGRPPKLYAYRYQGNKDPEPLKTIEKQRPPKIAPTVSEVDPTELRRGERGRPHAGGWVARMRRRPLRDPSGAEEMLLGVGEHNNVRTIRLDCGGGWNATYREGPKKCSLTITQPSRKMPQLTLLEDYTTKHRPRTAQQVWIWLQRAFGFEEVLLEENDRIEVGIPIEDEGLAREAGQRITTPDGDMWVDRSEPAVVPGTVEVEGDAPVMLGLAAMPNLLGNLNTELRHGREDFTNTIIELVKLNFSMLSEQQGKELGVQKGKIEELIDMMKAQNDLPLGPDDDTSGYQ